MAFFTNHKNVRFLFFERDSCSHRICKKKKKNVSGQKREKALKGHAKFDDTFKTQKDT